MAVHASHAALPYPVKGARFSVLVPYLDADGDPTAPTTPDTEISKDNGAAADCAEEASATSGMDGMALITLSGAETNCSCLALNAKVASGPKATLLTLYPRVLPVAFTGTASAGAAGTITLAGCPAIADLLIGCIVRTTGGTGGGGTGGANNQARVITAYTSGRVATVVPDWETAPSSDTTFEVLLTEAALLRFSDLRLWNGTAVATPDTAGYPKVTVKSGSGTGELNITSGVVQSNMVQISADATAADNCESFFDGDGYADVMIRTTVASVTSNQQFVLSAGSTNINAYQDCVVVIQSSAGAVDKMVMVCSSYTGGTREVNTRTDPGVFTVQAGDHVTILADRSLKPSVDSRPITVSTTGGVALQNGAHGGTSAVLTLERVVVASTTSNEPAIKATGNGTGAGVLATGGATGAGLRAIGGATSGAGILAIATTSGSGIAATGGATSGAGITATAPTSGAGIQAIGGDTGAGMFVRGGATGHGIHAVRGDTSGDGILASGDVDIRGNITGNLSGTIGGLTSAALAQFFTVDSGETFGDAVAGSVVFEIVDNAGGGGLDAAGVRAAIGMASANLDTQLAAIVADTNELQTDWANGGRLDLLIDAVKAKTDNLPSDPADASVVAGLIAAVETKVDTVDTLVDAIKVTTDKLDDTLEDDGGTYRFTQNALEQGPGGGYRVEFEVSVKSTAGTFAQLSAWLVQAGALVDLESIDATPTLTVVVREHGSGVDLFTATGTVADLINHRFEIEQADPGFTDDRQYAATVTITLNSDDYETEHVFTVQGA